MTKKIIIISGPTASGKTSTSIELAQKYGGEIINFDSLLFYKELVIGNARPSEEECQGIPHHLIATHSIASPLTAADFYPAALKIIDQLHQQNKIVYLVGGSGFYLQALLYGMYESKTPSQDLLQKSEDLYQKEGIAPFIDILKECDPASFERYHQNDHYRIRRAVEHYWATKTPFSSVREKMPEQKKQGPLYNRHWNCYHAYLDLPKEEHFNIIQKRTEQMIDAGLIEEVRQLLNGPFTGEERPLLSIGYKETQMYLRGEIESLAGLKERINISTRQLAKAQRTWFKKWDKKTYNPLTEKDILRKNIATFLGK